MNTLIKFTLVLSLVLVVESSLAANNQHYKCYVEYAGGGDGIQFIYSDKDDSSTVAASLNGLEVAVIGKNKKAHVYKVGECVLENESFTLGRAQELDKVTPR